MASWLQPTALSVFEQWRVRPVAALGLLDPFIVFCEDLTFDIDLLPLDQA
jgi:hypothetical protein